MIGPIVDDKIELDEKQKEALSRFETMIIYTYSDLITESMIEAMQKEGEESEDYKQGYKQGYAKAMWNVTMFAAQAEDGYLPTDETMKKWSDEQTKKMIDEGYEFKEIEIGGRKFTEVKFNPTDIKFGDHEVEKVEIDEDKSVQANKAD